MTELRFEKLPIWSAVMNGESTLPLLYDNPGKNIPGDFDLDEDDELYLNFSIVQTAFPYRSQNMYSRTLNEFGKECVVLENAHIKATFIPSLGGKLWSLFDKDEGKELLFANHVFRPAYLALRNAWASGGVEWNCGAFSGHHPHTCADMFTAFLSAEESGLDCPVLRLYNYERIRGVTYQMDFYLPEDSHFLHCRMRVVNENLTMTEMYWWSNIAVPTKDDCRNVVPADQSYTHVKGIMTKVSMPVFNGNDVSYPKNNPVSIDFFYKTTPDRRYYTSYIGKDGYGFVQTSTSRLTGRKLFVWGNGQGGRKWQEYLSGDDGHGKYSDGKYCEIQCGIAKTQYEATPMPPKTAWEWIEYYGSIKTDGEKIHGEWHGAQAEVEKVLEGLAPERSLEEELRQTKKMALTPAKTVSYAEGWAALENERREKVGLKPMSPHLDFGKTGEPQEMWKLLLETGSLSDSKPVSSEKAPLSYMRDENWVNMLASAAKKKDKDSWLAHYELGCSYLSEAMLEKAKAELDLSVSLNENAWNTYALAEYNRLIGNSALYRDFIIRASALAPDDVSLTKLTFRALAGKGMYAEIKALSEKLSPEMLEVPRVRLYRAVAALRLGDIDLADELLNKDGGLEVPDIQEGELTVTELWFGIEEAKAEKDGIPFDKSKAKPPKKFDFRMFSAD